MNIKEGTYIRIPSKIQNMDTHVLPMECKYLYGLILYWSYYEAFDHTIKELEQELGKKESAIRRYIKKLSDLKLIKIDIKNHYRRVITPLVLDGVNIVSESEKEAQEKEEILRQKRSTKETPQIVKEFYNDIGTGTDKYEQPF